MKLSAIAKDFNIEQRDAYKTILAHSNAAGVLLLSTEDELTTAAAQEITETIARLKAMVMSPLVGLRSLPIDKECRLYFLYNDGDDLVFVGKTNNIVARVGTHMSTKEFDSVESFIIDKNSVHLVELVNIYHHQPPLNVSEKSGVLYLATVLRNCVFEEFS